MEHADYSNYSIHTLRKIAEVLDLETVVSLKEKKQRDEPVIITGNIVSFSDYQVPKKKASVEKSTQKKTVK